MAGESQLTQAKLNGAGIAATQHRLLQAVAGYQDLLRMPGSVARTIGVSNRSNLWVYVGGSTASPSPAGGYAKAVPPNYSSVFPIGATQFVSFLVENAPDGTTGPPVDNPVIDVSASPLPTVAVQDVPLTSGAPASRESTYIGAINGATGQVTFSDPSGIAGTVLPPAAPGPPPGGNEWCYVVCYNAGQISSGPAAGLILNVGDWLYSNGVNWAVFHFGPALYPYSPYVTYADPVYARSRPYIAQLAETMVSANGSFATIVDINYLLPPGRIMPSVLAVTVSFNIYPAGATGTVYALDFALSLAGPFMRRDFYRFPLTPQPAYMGGSSVASLLTVSGPNPRIQILVRDMGGYGCSIVGANSADPLWASVVTIADLGPASGSEMEMLPPRGTPLPVIAPAAPRSYFRAWAEYYSDAWRRWYDLGRRRSAPAIAQLRRIANGNGKRWTNGRIGHGK